MRLKIKLVMGITVVLIFRGLIFFIVNTFVRYEEELGKVSLFCIGEGDKK
ncbi:MAG: hypothetical protein ACLT0R_01160 [Paraclostridium sordellii]|nr:hypothetical protein [Paeniclostridium sordellii]